MVSGLKKKEQKRPSDDFNEQDSLPLLHLEGGNALRNAKSGKDASTTENKKTRKIGRLKTTKGAKID